MRVRNTGNPEAFDKAADFMWRHARLLERRLFEHRFAGGEAGFVASALAAYQNADGGFGNALEPDKRCPDSQPVDVEFALRALDRIDAFTRGRVGPVCDWLASVTTAEGGIPFSLPTLNRYPHAPWWEAPDRPGASLNPTAAIAGLLHKHGVEHPWVDTATAYCIEAIADWNGTEYHTVMPVVTFLEHVPDRAFAERELARLQQRLAGTIETDPDAEGYVHLPLDWAPTPASPLVGMFDRATLDRHVSALARKQQEDGGWTIPWPTVSDAVTFEWRGIRTLSALETLRAYG